MQFRLPPDIEAQIKDRLATGHYANEEEVLREALRALKCQDNDVTAIRVAIADK